MFFYLLVQFAHLRHLNGQFFMLTHHIIFLITTVLLLHEQLILLMEADIVTSIILKHISSFTIHSRIILFSTNLVLLRIFRPIFCCIIIKWYNYKRAAFYPSHQKESKRIKTRSERYTWEITGENESKKKWSAKFMADYCTGCDCIQRISGTSYSYARFAPP